MANYGENARPPDLVPGWLLGGNRKWRVLHALAHPDRAEGWLCSELAEELGCGPTTVFEVVRGLRPLGVVASTRGGRHQLNTEAGLGEALRRFVDALAPFTEDEVDRAPRGTRRS
jgi:DNA-binding IclR family transcriptional regulator